MVYANEHDIANANDAHVCARHACARTHRGRPHRSNAARLRKAGGRALGCSTPGSMGARPCCGRPAHDAAMPASVQASVLVASAPSRAPGNRVYGSCLDVSSAPMLRLFTICALTAHRPGRTAILPSNLSHLTHALAQLAGPALGRPCLLWAALVCSGPPLSALGCPCLLWAALACTLSPDKPAPPSSPPPKRAHGTAHPEQLLEAVDLPHAPLVRPARAMAAQQPQASRLVALGVGRLVQRRRVGKRQPPPIARLRTCTRTRAHACKSLRAGHPMTRRAKGSERAWFAPASPRV
eukprot:364150-Chlamydomonas_euryale.AAC.2